MKVETQGKDLTPSVATLPLCRIRKSMILHIKKKTETALPQLRRYGIRPSFWSSCFIYAARRQNCKQIPRIAARPLSLPLGHDHAQIVVWRPTMFHLLILLLFAAQPAETLVGKVVGVTDGDTITLLVDKTQVKIRLAGIDAPESKQPFGTKAKQALLVEGIYARF